MATAVCSSSTATAVCSSSTATDVCSSSTATAVCSSSDATDACSFSEATAACSSSDASLTPKTIGSEEIDELLQNTKNLGAFATALFHHFFETNELADPERNVYGRACRAKKDDFKLPLNPIYVSTIEEIFKSRINGGSMSKKNKWNAAVCVLNQHLKYLRNKDE